MITEDYVSFEIAKLLKEKGFTEECMYFYDWNKESKSYHICSRGSTCNNEEYPDEYSMPTFQMAMKWLREKYMLEIYPYHNNSLIYRSKSPFKWWYEIIKWPNSVSEHESKKYEEFDTYEDVCEAAIKYCLENLI